MSLQHHMNKSQDVIFTTKVLPAQTPHTDTKPDWHAVLRALLKAQILFSIQ